MKPLVKPSLHKTTMQLIDELNTERKIITAYSGLTLESLYYKQWLREQTAYHTNRIKYLDKRVDERLERLPIGIVLAAINDTNIGLTISENF